MGNPARDMHVTHTLPPPPSRCRGLQGWWTLTGVRVDVPEPGGEERPDEEGTEGDAQDSGQPQPVVCRRSRPSAPPCWGGGPFPPPFLTQLPLLPQTHCQVAASCPSPSPPGPSRRWWCSAEVEAGVRGGAKAFGDQGCSSWPGSTTQQRGTNPPSCHHRWWGPAQWWHHGVCIGGLLTLTSKPALHLRVAEKGTRPPSGMV